MKKNEDSISISMPLTSQKREPLSCVNLMTCESIQKRIKKIK